MDEYTPTTNEIRYRVEHDWAPYGEGAFDSWYAAEKAKWQAEALRDAAEGTGSWVVKPDADGEWTSIERWLLSIADRIEGQ